MNNEKTAGPTDGPWIIDEVNTANGVSYFINHLWEDHDDPVDDSDEFQTHTDEIAEVVMDYRGDRALCNARLLAAAPDLLSACKLARGMTGHNHWDNTMRYGEGCPLCIEQKRIMGIIEKAIGKAENGEVQ